MKLEYLTMCSLCESEDIAPVDSDLNIFKCNHCGYIFDNPRPTFDEIKSFYSNEGKYGALIRKMWLKEEKARDILWQRRLVKLKKLKENGALLDIGAGIGQFLQLAKNDFEVLGTEISKIAIAIAKAKYDLNLIEGRIEDIDFGHRRFDVITLFHVLEHVPDPSSLLKRCYDLLSKDGVLIIATPNEIDSFRRTIIRLLSVLPVSRFRKYGKFGLPKLELGKSLNEIHLSHFTLSTLRWLIKKSNFIVVEDTLDPYYVATGIKKIVDDLLYLIFLVIKKISKVNLYDTIWIVAKRSARYHC